MPLQKARLKISDLSKNRKHKSVEKNKRIMAVSLSLTSMVDMFAILVIFLLTTGQTVEEWVKLDHDIALPRAKANDEPKRAVTLQVAVDKVYGQDSDAGAEEKTLVSTSQISKGPVIVDSVKTWLSRLKDKEGYVNIVADEKVPYGVVRRLISTSRVAGFRNVNLAVFPR